MKSCLLYVKNGHYRLLKIAFNLLLGDTRSLKRALSIKVEQSRLLTKEKILFPDMFPINH